ncbi:MAG: DUF971 domain-containing protein [Myxococcota bacterium]
MMARPTPDPIEVELQSAAARLRVAWDDDHESFYPLTYLRGFCPCAKCQGHASGWTFIPVDAPEVTGIEEVGNYALKIVWRDGNDGPHTTGIYSFDILHQLCPCDACQQAQGEAHVVHLMPD